MFLSKLVAPVTDAVELPLFEALGRVLASDVVSPFDVPPHDKSAMDGYAFAGAELASGADLRLQVVGKAWQGQLKPGDCVKIMTGTIMPPGLDTVVPQEMVTVRDSSISLPPRLLQPGDNRRMGGEDLTQGKPAISKGELLTPARLGLAASLGLNPRGLQKLSCLRQLRVTHFSTGDEILSSGPARCMPLTGQLNCRQPMSARFPWETHCL